MMARSPGPGRSNRTKPTGPNNGTQSTAIQGIHPTYCLVALGVMFMLTGGCEEGGEETTSSDGFTATVTDGDPTTSPTTGGSSGSTSGGSSTSTAGTATGSTSSGGTSETSGGASSGGTGPGTTDTTGDPPSGDTVKLFVLAGQSNANGHGRVPQANFNPSQPYSVTLEGIVDEGYITDVFLNPRNDVDFQYFNPADGTLKIPVEPLQPGQGHNREKMGVELGFGHVIGDRLEEPVFIYKFGPGGATLAESWRPPTAVANRGGTTGPHYTSMLAEVATLRGSPPPGYPDKEWEMAGFIWIQGWNDGLNADMRAEYPENVRDLAKDVRSDLGVADLPFIHIEGPDLMRRMYDARIAGTDLINGDVPGRAIFVETTEPFETMGWFAQENAVSHFNESARCYLEAGRWAADAAITAGFY